MDPASSNISYDEDVVFDYFDYDLYLSFDSDLYYNPARGLPITSPPAVSSTIGPISTSTDQEHEYTHKIVSKHPYKCCHVPSCDRTQGKGYFTLLDLQKHYSAKHPTFDLPDIKDFLAFPSPHDLSGSAFYLENSEDHNPLRKDNSCSSFLPKSANDIIFLDKKEEQSQEKSDIPNPSGLDLDAKSCPGRGSKDHPVKVLSNIKEKKVDLDGLQRYSTTRDELSSSIHLESQDLISFPGISIDDATQKRFSDDDQRFDQTTHAKKRSWSHILGDFTCLECHAHFTRVDLLERHINRHHDEELEGDNLFHATLKTRERAWKPLESEAVEKRPNPILNDHQPPNQQETSPESKSGTLNGAPSSQTHLLDQDWEKIHVPSPSTLSFLFGSTPQDRASSPLSCASPKSSPAQSSTISSDLHSEGDSMTSDDEGNDIDLCLPANVMLDAIAVPLLGELLLAYEATRRRPQSKGAVHKGTAVPNAGSESASMGSSDTSKPTKRKWANRSQDKGSDDDDDDAEEDEQSPSSSTKQQLEVEKALLACPFSKWKPSSYSCCYKYRMTAIRRVKQHLRRHHKRPLQCPTCSQIFPSEEDYDPHVESRSCTSQPRVEPEGVTRLQQKSLERMSDRRLSVSEQWFSIFRILFPGSPLPESPYLEANVSLELKSFKDFMDTEGLRMLEEKAREEIPSELMPQTEEIVAFTQKLYQQGIPEIFRIYETSRPHQIHANSNCGAPSSAGTSRQSAPIKRESKRRNIEPILDRDVQEQRESSLSLSYLQVPLEEECETSPVLVHHQMGGLSTTSAVSLPVSTSASDKGKQRSSAFGMAYLPVPPEDHYELVSVLRHHQTVDLSTTSAVNRPVLASASEGNGPLEQKSTWSVAYPLVPPENQYEPGLALEHHQTVDLPTRSTVNLPISTLPSTSDMDFSQMNWDFPEPLENGNDANLDPDLAFLTGSTAIERIDSTGDWCNIPQEEQHEANAAHLNTLPFLTSAPSNLPD
ncbi:hypothetical protein F5Y16DRAFT_422642 [Xylariaceae sp. FL0255]|nr:hypothetical protein F5Y16DRAFT_422642 [Xylariaceae sp. FL0255]